MTSAAEIVPSARRELEVLSTPEWASLCTRRQNVLLVGPAAVTESLVLFLAPYFRRPVSWKASQSPYPYPVGECGTLVLENVGALSRREQVELHRWLDAADRHTQVVSTTAEPLFPLVGRGQFDGALYYRLNLILLCVDAGGALSQDEGSLTDHSDAAAAPGAQIMDVPASTTG